VAPIDEDVDLYEEDLSSVEDDDEDYDPFVFKEDEE